VLAGLCAGAALLGGCGGGSSQTAHEPTGTYRVRVVHASFPVRQAVSRKVPMTIAVRNVGPRTLPNVAVSLNSLYYASRFPGLADPKRPIWAIERGPGTIAKHTVESERVAPPGGGQTAYVETWALGPLAPGATRVFHWVLAPLVAGLHAVNYTVAAGLGGNAHARLLTGAVPRGRFHTLIAGRPPARHVDPNTGKVVYGAYPPPSGE